MGLMPQARSFHRLLSPSLAFPRLLPRLPPPLSNAHGDAEGADLPSSILGAKRCEPRHRKSYLGQSVCSTARDPMIGVGQASVTTVDRRYARLHECPLHISRSPFDLPLSPFTWPPTITTTSFGSREDLNCVPVTYRTRGSHAKAPPSPTCTSTKSTRSSRRPGAWPGRWRRPPCRDAAPAAAVKPQG